MSVAGRECVRHSLEGCPTGGVALAGDVKVRVCGGWGCCLVAGMAGGGLMAVIPPLMAVIPSLMPYIKEPIALKIRDSPSVDSIQRQLLL